MHVPRTQTRTTLHAHTTGVTSSWKRRCVTQVDSRTHARVRARACVQPIYMRRGTHARTRATRFAL